MQISTYVFPFDLGGKSPNRSRAIESNGLLGLSYGCNCMITLEVMLSTYVTMFHEFIKILAYPFPKESLD